jgi:hypothetical protein
LTDPTLPEHITATVERLKEPLGLTGWSIQIETGDIDAKATCSAQPEYKQILLSFNLDRLETGDELDEIIVHEMMHPHTWTLFQEAEDLATVAAAASPEAVREAMKAYLLEKVRFAGEDAATQVGFVTIRLLRRLWAAERELTNVRTENKLLRKQARVVAQS